MSSQLLLVHLPVSVLLVTMVMGSPSEVALGMVFLHSNRTVTKRRTLELGVGEYNFLTS